MTSTPSTNLNGPAISSQLGRKWLEASDSNSVLGEQSVDDSAGAPLSEHVQGAAGQMPPESGTVFVVIPDVQESVAHAFEALDYSQLQDPDELAIALSKASDERLTAIRTAKTTNEADSNQPKLSQSLTDSETNSEMVEPQNDLAEPPTEWTDKPATKETPRKDTGKPPKQSDQDPAINKLANSIVERFPLGDPTVLLFVGSEQNSHVDETSARVASALAERRIGRILLLDSDTTGHALSNASGVGGEPGITDVVNKSVAWESTVYGRSATGLDFMAAGTGVFRHPEASDRLRHAVAEMKRDYQFICISAGDARGHAAQIWSEVCDGSYLLVSLKNSNQTIAKSAVAELQSCGARLLGCVVTDVD